MYDELVQDANFVILNPDEFIRLYLDITPIYPSDDAWANENAPTTNYGDHAALRIRGSGSSKEIISYLKFYVNTEDTITSAKLKLRAEDKAIENCTVYAVNDVSWEESTLSWNNKPAVGLSLDSVTSVSIGAWTELDVISHINSNGAFSLALKTTIDAAGRDWYSNDTTSKPELILTTEAPAEPGKASNPNPADSSNSVSITADLSWTAASGADNYDVYFGTTSPGTFQGNQTGLTFDPGTMSATTTYYWRIDPNNAVGKTTGDIWSFTTADAEPVTLEFNPSDDAFASQANATTNYGSHTALRVRDSGSNKEIHSFLKFTVSGISGTVSSVKLKLRVEGKDIEDCSVYAVNDTSWSEGTVTWNTKPSMGSSLDSVTNVSSGSWVEFDVSGHIDTNGTFSLGLKTNTNKAGRDWYSEESASDPVLEVIYQP